MRLRRRKHRTASGAFRAGNSLRATRRCRKPQFSFNSATPSPLKLPVVAIKPLEKPFSQFGGGVHCGVRFCCGERPRLTPAGPAVPPPSPITHQVHTAFRS